MNDIEPDHNPTNEYHILCVLVIYYIVHFYNYDHDDEIKCINPEYCFFIKRRVWRYQRGNQNPCIEEEQTTQGSKEKVQMDKQRSIKCTHKTKDRVTRTSLKIRGELRCSGRVSSSCSTIGTCPVNLVTNPVIKSWMRKGQRSVYNKWNISVVICDTDNPQRSTKSLWWL